MPYLDFVSDSALQQEVRYVLEKGQEAKALATRKFGRNVIDPFAAAFEIASFDIDYKTWHTSETARQAQKTLQNHVGAFHQKLLGHVEGWEDKGTGEDVDLLCESRKIIAEVKNKYSTVSGGKLSSVYHELEDLVMPKASRYKDYTAYFVTIIPRKPTRFDEPFRPSDRGTGSRHQDNPLVRIIDGASFYAMVTGKNDALSQLYKALPSVIEDVFNDMCVDGCITEQDKGALQGFFSSAFG